MEEKRICAQCGKELPSNKRKYCSYECEAAYLKEKYKKLNNPFKGKSSATTGAISELRVAVDLMVKGYDVFRALSPSCPCDLAILKDSKLLRIEVRTVGISVSGKPYKHTDRHDNPDEIDHYAWVLPDKIMYEPSLE